MAGSRHSLPNKIFRAEVVETHRLTSGMMRLTFAGPGLVDFRSTGVGDEYLRVFLPADGQLEPQLPQPKGDYWEYEEGIEPSPLRTYTVRRFDTEPSRVTIDFVVHDGGVAASWAQRAKPGDVVGLNTPTALYDPPADLAWQIVLADAAGLPAAARLLEQTPPGVRTRAVLEVASAADRQAIAHHDGVEIVWVYGGNGHGPSRLEEILRAAELPTGSGYVWVAGETKVMRGVRRYLRHELRLPATGYKVIGYWTAKAEEWTARYQSLPAQTLAELTALWETDRDAEEIEDEYISRLEALGL
jgi:NADPH-dependent ferric siderophore reductase